MSRLATLALAGLSLLASPACTGSSNGKAKPAESACTGAREHVESLYRAELPASGEGARTTEAALARMRAAGGPDSFLWVHYFDAHLPYLPPSPWDQLYLPDPDAVGRARSHDLQVTMREADGVSPEIVAEQTAFRCDVGEDEG